MNIRLIHTFTQEKREPKGFDTPRLSSSDSWDFGGMAKVLNSKKAGNALGTGRISTGTL